jgi:CDP-diacylglycerol---glycerol-3-phosphate 3-phosphatidyltransferase
MNAVALNVPLALTLTRLTLSPVVLPFLLIEFLPQHSLFYNGLLGLFFVALSLTDFFDGYLARRYGQITSLGSLLDPIADKFLLYATLVSLLYIHKIYFYSVILFLGREFFIMGLREIALSYGFSLVVSYTAKIKTTVQMVYLAFVIMNPYQAYGLHALSNSVEHLLLALALFFSLYSAIEYSLVFIKQLKDLNDLP